MPVSARQQARAAGRMHLSERQHAEIAFAMSELRKIRTHKPIGRDLFCGDSAQLLGGKQRTRRQVVRMLRLVSKRSLLRTHGKRNSEFFSWSFRRSLSCFFQHDLRRLFLRVVHARISKRRLFLRIWVPLGCQSNGKRSLLQNRKSVQERSLCECEQFLRLRRTIGNESSIRASHRPIWRSSSRGMSRLRLLSSSATHSTTD